jgi:hypothetical protein
VRTTLTLEDDVVKLIRKEIRRTGEPLKQTVNRLLRSGLIHEQNAPPAKPFRVRSKGLGLPKEWTSGCIEDLVEMLDGPGHK